MNVSNSQWFRVLLNDTKELMKKQSTNVTRRLFSKMNSPALKKQSSKSGIYKRYLNKSKRFSPRLKNTPRHSPKFPEWKTEYDVWNMVINAIDKNVSNASRENCQSNVIGVRGSNDNIRLIENRQEFNDQILVCSNGIKTRVDQLLSPSDSAADVSLKIKFKMVPVIEEVTLVRNSRETSYKFDAGTNDINNNAMECQDNDTEQQKEEDDDIDRTLSFGDETLSADEIDDNEFDRTIMNVMSETEYSAFFNELQPEACSTFISESKENRPFVAIPKKEKTFFDSPMPDFHKRPRPPASSTFFGKNQILLRNLINVCKNAKILNQLLCNDLSKIENTCASLMNSTSVSDLSMSGIDFLSDTVEL